MKRLLTAGVALALLAGSAGEALAQPHRPPPGRPGPPAGPPPGHWGVGQRLPRQYWGSRYYVNDWRSRRLPPPRRGYRWVRRDNNYLMVAATTGLIASVIAASR